MEQIECELFDDKNLGEETLDDDVEMFDAEPMDTGVGFQTVEAGPLADNVTSGGGSVVEGFQESSISRSRKVMPDNAIRGAKRKRKKKTRRSSSDTNITDINRFVIDTCRKLKEKKPYLVWTAVGCLGVSAVSGLLKEVPRRSSPRVSRRFLRACVASGKLPRGSEVPRGFGRECRVEAIQCCGGQKTADGRRYRTGGGVLWNILKAREPKAYKEIMVKGREFEKQFRHPQNRKSSSKTDAVSQSRSVHDAAKDSLSDASEKMPCNKASESQRGHSSLHDRIRVPVSYEDLFEEGEIHGQDLFL